MTADPLAPLIELPGVAEASDRVRDALGRAHRHRANLRGWPVTAAEATLRAARASSVLDGGPVRFEDLADSSGVSDPVFGGALRVAQALEGGGGALIGVWQRSPLQALARLHMLVAADQVDDEQLGRPRADPEFGPRLELLVELVTGRTQVPAPVVAAVAHGELLTLKPFGSADGVVARGVAPGDDCQRAGSARTRCARGELDAQARRLSRCRTRIRRRHTGRSRGVVGAVLPGAAGRRAGGAVDRRIVAGQGMSHPEKEARRVERAAFRDASVRRPLARNSVTKRAISGCVGGLGDLATLQVTIPPKGPFILSAFFAITQARNTSAIIAAMTPRGCRVPCWAPGLGERTFSSGST